MFTSTMCRYERRKDLDGSTRNVRVTLADRQTAVGNKTRRHMGHRRQKPKMRATAARLMGVSKPTARPKY